MPLLALWKSNPSAISAFSIEQIVAVAGSGELRDNSDCSTELRTYLAEAPTEKLASYLDYCLSQPFTKSGYVLQDIVNEFGRRLDYKTEHGRYQGTVNTIGFDGIWTAPESNSLVIEVKTTDAYRLSLDKLVEYRRGLLSINRISVDSSILIIAGRADTGELEAQIRGSRHAWDIRLISADALLKLVRIKQSTEGRETAEKIRRLLVPVEFTRLDGLIDVIFTTAKDVENSTQAEAVGFREEDEQEARDNGTTQSWDFTAPAELNAKRSEILKAVSEKLSANLVKHSRALFQSAAHDVRVAVTISKRYDKKGYQPYWYAYHPQWDEFLVEAKRGFLVLGCMDRQEAYLVPREVIQDYLPNLNVTKTKDGREYWHVKLFEATDGTIMMQMPKGDQPVSLEQYRLILTT